MRHLFIFGLASLSLACLSGCVAFEPFARADSTGYEVGARGTWAGMKSAAASLVDGKAVRP